MRARPMIMVVRMLPAAWGLRATPSQAATTALPWARPQPAAAMARERWGTYWPSDMLFWTRTGAPWAKATAARVKRKAVVRNFFMVVLLVGCPRGSESPGRGNGFF